MWYKFLGICLFESILVFWSIENYQSWVNSEKWSYNVGFKFVGRAKDYLGKKLEVPPLYRILLPSITWDFWLGAHLSAISNRFCALGRKLGTWFCVSNFQMYKKSCHLLITHQEMCSVSNSRTFILYLKLLPLKSMYMITK